MISSKSWKIGGGGSRGRKVAAAGEGAREKPGNTGEAGAFFAERGEENKPSH